MFFEWNIVEFVLLNGMDCVLAMLVDTVFETSCFFFEYQKSENQSLEERKCQLIKDEPSFSKSGVC